MKPIDEISSDIIGVAMSIHREIGPGLLESVYQAILAKKLSRLGYEVEIEKPLGFSCSLFMRSNCSLIFVC